MIIFDWLRERLERRPEPFTWTDPQHKTGGVGICFSKSEEVRILSTPEAKPVPKFSPVICTDAAALIAYLGRHATPKETIVFANLSGLSACLDYTEPVEDPDAVLSRPGRATRRVTMPSAWSPDCAAALSAIEGIIGKWISLEQLETTLDVAGPFIKDLTMVRDTLMDLEGAEVVSAKRTMSGTSVQIGANVQAKEDRKIPPTLVFGGRFMGQTVVMEAPLRLRIQNRSIQFLLADNGCINKAKADAINGASAAISALGWCVIQGSVA